MLIISLSHRKSLFNSYHGPLACGGLWGGGGEEDPFLRATSFFWISHNSKFLWQPWCCWFFVEMANKSSGVSFYGGTLLIRSPMGQKKKNGHIYGVVEFNKKMWGGFCQGAKKVAIITRWPYHRGGRKAGFHCAISHLCNPNQIHSRHNYGPGLALEVYEKYHRTLKFETRLEISMPLYQTKYWAFNSSLSLYCREKRWHQIYLMLWIF